MLHSVAALNADIWNNSQKWSLKPSYSKRSIYTFKNLFYKYYWTYGDVLYIDWRENSQSYFHTLQAHDVSPTCDAADAKSIIQPFPHSSQHVTGNSSHILSDAPLQIIRTLRDFLSICAHDMNLTSVVFLNKFLKVYASFWIALYKDMFVGSGLHGSLEHPVPE
jgi:hypothetical protein